MISTVHGKPIEKWVEEFDSLPRSTFKEVIKLSPACAAFLVLEFLKANPPMLLRNMQDMRDWLLDELPHQHIEAAVPVAAAQVVSTGKTVLLVRIDDTIRLRSLNERSTPILNKCGHWWKVVQAQVTRDGRKDRWYLRSLTRKQQGLRPIPGFNFENLRIDKQDDPNFEVDRVCPFPKEFNYKEYE
jgi:hypothetical protein